MKAIFPTVTLLVLATELLAQDPSPTAFELDPSLPYQAARSNPVTYDVDFSVVVTPPYKAKKLAVWLPIPTSDSAQEVSASRLSSFPLTVELQVGTEPIFGNKFAYFEFSSPQGAQIVRHQFRIKVWELNWNVDPARVAEVKEWPLSFDRYQGSDSQAVVVDGRFSKLLNEITVDKTNAARGLGTVMRWVQDNFEYDHHDASLRASSEHALVKRRGHCSDYHSFCASLGRLLGTPTRVTYGINAFPKNSPSHCKLEAFLAPYGWVSFDVSETQKLVGELAKSANLSDSQRAVLIERAQARLARGFRDNTWFLQTRGTDYDLTPKASRRVAVVRTAYIEADGVPLPEPDPADKNSKSFAWMTVHDYRADRIVPYPFTDWNTLGPVEKE